MIQKFRKIFWTEHSKIKMRQYGLSKTKLLNLLYNPERKEQGIALGTTAVMKTNPSRSPVIAGLYGASKKFTNKSNALTKTKWQKPKSSPGEIWLMYKDVKDFRKIISAWRYPGVSKPGEEIPVPEEILRELLENENNEL